MTAKHISDLDVCYQCERLLAPHEEVYCGPCGKKVLDTWNEPTDAELARRDALIERGWRELAALIFPLVCLILAGTALWTSDARAHDTTLIAPHAINGRIYEWPAIGTEAYSHSCSIVRFWEDFNAVAYCSEDGATYKYLPVGQPHENTAGNPIRDPGWYPIEATR